jgi:hypothetical protein
MIGSLGHGFAASPLYSDRRFSWLLALSLSLPHSRSLLLCLTLSQTLFSLNLYLSLTLSQTLFSSFWVRVRRGDTRKKKKKKGEKGVAWGSGQWVHFIREKETKKVGKILNKKMRGRTGHENIMSYAPP